MDARTSRYHEVYARALRDPEGFWAEAAQAIDWYEPARKVFDKDAGFYGRWFTGASCNTCCCPPSDWLTPTTSTRPCAAPGALRVPAPAGMGTVVASTRSADGPSPSVSTTVPARTARAMVGSARGSPHGPPNG